MGRRAKPIPSTKPSADSQSAKARPDRLSLSEIVKDHILAKILDGSLQPGDRLIEMKIASEIGASQAPVREAIRELEALGVVETNRNRGSRVRVFDTRQIQGIYDVRAELEGYAVRVLYRNVSFGTADLVVALEEMRRAAARKDLLSFAVHNAAFHRNLVKQTENAALLETWDMLNIKSRTFFNIMTNHKDLRELAESHVEIVEAFGRKPVAEVEALVKSHVLANSPSHVGESLEPFAGHAKPRRAKTTAPSRQHAAGLRQANTPRRNRQPSAL